MAKYFANGIGEGHAVVTPALDLKNFKSIIHTVPPYLCLKRKPTQLLDAVRLLQPRKMYQSPSVAPTPIDILFGGRDISDAGSNPGVIAINGILQACLQMLNEVFRKTDWCVCDCVAGSEVRLPPRGTSWISCKG
ncbi:hypothetical protein WR25_26667 [Diploscapter pachys]|uniref:Macro domain-containing protein n=1 Tax=Diploscapter pachys TaxID=2018661 RepID=A0A2A2KHV9_9BILA|nr:hypothetical protein WR25_26667 [Diploscapter pachys]